MKSVRVRERERERYVLNDIKGECRRKNKIYCVLIQEEEKKIRSI